MTCVGHFELNYHVYKKFVDKNRCLCTNVLLKNGLIYEYIAFEVKVINASTTYINSTL